MAETLTQREIKFRVWDKKRGIFHWGISNICLTLDGNLMWQFGFNAPDILGKEERENYILQQYTGLKDKQTLTDIYEGDIIDMDGNIRGNIYESPEVYKSLTTSVVAGMGYQDWEDTKQRLVRQGKLIAEQSNLPQILRELG